MFATPCINATQISCRYVWCVMVERWLPVVGFPDYEVSDRGRVRSLARSRVNSVGVMRRIQTRILQPAINSSAQDYRRVVLYRDGRPAVRLIHRLVLEAFSGPCPAGHEARHFNDIGYDNRLKNLLWGTRADNRADAARNGKPPGGRRYAVVAAAGDAERVRAAYAAGASLKNISQQYKLNVHLVRDLVIDKARPPRFLRSRVAG